MAYKMEKRFINRLAKDELVFELEYRGLQNVSTQGIDDLRKQLRKLVKLEEVGASFSPKVIRPASEEYEICSGKIRHIVDRIAGYNEGELRRFSFKAEATLNHTMLRLSRIDATPDKDLATKIVDSMAQGAELLAVVKEAQIKETVDSNAPHLSEGEVSNKYPSDVRTILSTSSSSSGSDSPSEVDNKKHRKVQKNKKGTNKPAARQLFDSDSDEVSASQSRRSCFRRTRVSDWGLKFSGQEDAMSIRRFFVEVHEARRTNRMSRADLLREAKNLFEGPALEVFRSCSRSFKDWNHLEERISLAFTDPRYDKVLKREIEDRKQGPDEKIIVYLSKMDNLFNLLSDPLPEREKLDIISSNILPEYQIALSLQRYGSLKQLETLLIKLEKSRTQAMASTKPQLPKCVEPSLQHAPKLKNRPGQHPDSRVAALDSKESGSSPSEDKNRVSAQDGLKGKEVYCYTCKTPGVIRPRCPTCKAKKAGNAKTERESSEALPGTLN